MIPFVTEELWTALTGGTSVVTAAWPGERAGPAAAQPARDPAAEAEIGSLMALVTEVRRFRSDQGLRPAQPVPAALSGIVLIFRPDSVKIAISPEVGTVPPLTMKVKAVFSLKGFG